MVNHTEKDQPNKEVTQITQHEAHLSKPEWSEDGCIASGSSSGSSKERRSTSVRGNPSGKEPFLNNQMRLAFSESPTRLVRCPSFPSSRDSSTNLLPGRRLQAHDLSSRVSGMASTGMIPIHAPTTETAEISTRSTGHYVSCHSGNSALQDCSGSENNRTQIGIAQRLREVLQGGENRDFLHQSDTGNGVLQWLQALDLQIMGACRADERLRPMLQLNVSCSTADDKLLAQLNQHFKARELGMLARCLCVPLVSIRVGKVQRQGHMFHPTSASCFLGTFLFMSRAEQLTVKQYLQIVRTLLWGHLSLTLLPSSDLRLSFVGDEGCMERLAVLSPSDENTNVIIEDIPVDVSGRSFLVKLPCGKTSYFWQSEKSKLVGDELLSKMKDLLRQRPSLAQLTGIRESRLDSFAAYLRTTFLGSSSSSQNDLKSSFSSMCEVSRSNLTVASSNASATDLSAQCIKSAQRMKSGLSHSGNQGSLSPRGNNFKDGSLRNISSIRNVSSAREKIKRLVNARKNFSISSGGSSVREQASVNLDHCKNGISDTENSRLPAGNAFLPEQYFHLPVSLDGIFPSQKPQFGGLPLSSSCTVASIPAALPKQLGESSIFSPYYCPCPLRTSTLQYTVTPPFLPSLPTEAVNLPPASPYLSAGSTSSFIPPLPLDLHNTSFAPLSLPVPPLVSIPAPLQTSTLSSVLSDQVVNVPLPVSSFVTVPTPQKISSFTPFFSDPIVHIPVLDFDSTGQGYLVSAGPSISPAISPILPGLLSTLIPESGDDNKEGSDVDQLLASLDFSLPWKSESEICCSSSVTSLSVDNFESIIQNPSKKRCLQNNRNILDASFSKCHNEERVHKGHFSDATSCKFQNSPAPFLHSANLDVKANVTGLVTGSRGLYAGPCDPLVSRNLVGGSRHKLTAAEGSRDTCQRNQSVENKINSSKQLDETSGDNTQSDKRDGNSNL